MTDTKNNDMAKVVSMTQVEFQLELDKARLEQKAIDDDHLREVKKMVVEKACKWWNKEMREVNYGTYNEAIKAFRKAMEE